MEPFIEAVHGILKSNQGIFLNMSYQTIFVITVTLKFGMFITNNFINTSIFFLLLADIYLHLFVIVFV